LWATIPVRAVGSGLTTTAFWPKPKGIPFQCNPPWRRCCGRLHRQKIRGRGQTRGRPKRGRASSDGLAHLGVQARWPSRRPRTRKRIGCSRRCSTSWRSVALSSRWQRRERHRKFGPMVGRVGSDPAATAGAESPPQQAQEQGSASDRRDRQALLGGDLQSKVVHEVWNGRQRVARPRIVDARSIAGSDAMADHRPRLDSSPVLGGECPGAAAIDLYYIPPHAIKHGISGSAVHCSFLAELSPATAPSVTIHTAALVRHGSFRPRMISGAMIAPIQAARDQRKRNDHNQKKRGDQTRAKVGRPCSSRPRQRQKSLR